MIPLMPLQVEVINDPNITAHRLGGVGGSVMISFPYVTRICAAIADGPIIELARFNRPMFPHDWRSHTADLSSCWDVWAEQPMRDAETITARPGTTRKLARIEHTRVNGLRTAAIERKNERAREARGRLYARREDL